ncbi:MAG: caspase family protein [Deltaproteobacteria bacterium]|nr:caspase family protein [Deltaproteobacteria bacterium]
MAKTDTTRRPPRAAPGLACLCALAVTSLAGDAARAAAPSSPRFAIVIGSNAGDFDEPALQFAERDAQRMTEVLTRLGRVRAEDVLTLLSPTAADLERALGTFRARVGDAGGQGAMVVVYYSGHADERHLHLSGTRYPFERLKADVRALGVDLSVFIVDACRSGGIVRVKGATPSELFAFDVQDRVVAEGVAILTSSAENEDAQESDRLGGGVFTHHLLNGLAGAADRSGDDKVSLAEVYQYAYTQTIASTSATRIVQHPTYAFDVTGVSEIVLTHLDEPAGRGQLRFAHRGAYLVFERSSGALVAELEALAGTDLRLKPGAYLVRRRDPSAVHEGQVVIDPRALTTLDSDAMQRVPYRHAVRKGYGIARSAWSVGAGFELGAPIIERTGTVLGAALGLQLDLAELAVQLRARFGTSDAANTHVALTQRMVGADLGVFHLFDVGRHGVGFGVRGGVDWLSQRFESTRVVPDVDQAIGRVGPFARGELALGGALTLTLDVGAEVHLIELARAAGGSELSSRAALSTSLGLSLALP